MPSDPLHDAIYLKILGTIEDNYRGVDGSFPVSPSAVATLASSAALAAIDEEGKTIVDQITPVEAATAETLAAALKAAAHTCSGECGLTEEACRTAHPISWAGTAREGQPDEVTWIEGSTTAIADAVLAALAERGLPAPPAGPALRTCLVPGCLAQYDAIAALTGQQPTRPEWSSEGWRILRSGMAFPAGGHVCPTHAQTVIKHLPRRATPGEAGWVQGDCACGDWTSPRQRWHGAVRGLWEEHLLDVLHAFAPPT
ncbi:hypothetical protein [Streptosporangium sp. NPDC048865]|uniref:hypothetical protein n=1 Tax=Streptosporangium sp. NPDC048865 TaxID=3155766 RepID=UPI003446E954